MNVQPYDPTKHPPNPPYKNHDSHNPHRHTHAGIYTRHQEPAASPLTNDAHHPNGVSFVSFFHLHGIIILQGGCLQDLRTCLFPLLEPCQGQAPRPRLNDLRVNSVDTLDDSNRLFPLSPYERG